MHTPASILGSNMNELQWNLELQTYHLITNRGPYLMIIKINKSTCRIIDFAVPADNWVKLKESEKKDKYLDLDTELKKN